MLQETSIYELTRSRRYIHHSRLKVLINNLDGWTMFIKFSWVYR